MAEISRIAADTRLLDALTHLASRAAAAILAVPRAALARREKPDGSPVTAADEAAESLILAGLRELLPDLPVVSEETAAAGAPAHAAPAFVLVDPLDGTRELLAGRDEFTVNIAIVAAGRPVLGIVAAPARELIWRGGAGAGAERLALAPGRPPQSASECVKIHVRPRPGGGLVALVSRSHLNPETEAYLSRFDLARRMPCGSALKFGLIAEGTADLYPRLSPTSEWDVAAGHAVLAAAGGSVVRPDGSALDYGHQSFRIPAFIAAGEFRPEDAP